MIIQSSYHHPMIQTHGMGKPHVALSQSQPTPDRFELRFGSKLDKNRGIELPMLGWDLGFEHSAQLQKALLILAADKKAHGDESSINLSLDSFPFNSGSWGMLAGVNGFTDAMALADYDINPVITAHASVEMLRPLLSANGKRYMYSRARIQMGPTKTNHNGPVRDSNARTRLWQENWRELEWLIMDRTGKPDRKAVQDDLRDGKEYNALAALSYGKNGLVDAIIVDEDAVLTRPALEAYYKAHNLDAAGQDKLNNQYNSLDKVVQWARKNKQLQPFAQFDPKSVSTATPTVLYKSAAEEEKKEDKKADSTKPKEGATPVDKVQGLIEQLTGAVKDLSVPKSETNKAEEKKEEKPKFHVYTGKKSEVIDKMPRLLELKEKETSDRLELEKVPAGLKSLLYRDSLYFPQGFDLKTGKEFQDQLLKLFDKRQKLREQGKKTSNIAIVENSPGGMSIVTEKLKSMIENGGNPVDVIVQGWGVSGGSKLVSMVDPKLGNRFATPNATILLHQTRGGIDLGPSNLALESNRGMNYSCEGYISLVAERSGRPLKEVQKDFTIDFWLNPVEAILYGSKGLVDGILVGPDTVLTRDTVMNYVVDQFNGNPKAAQKYINHKFEERRDGTRAAYPEDHQEAPIDPLANPLAVINTLKRQGKAVKLSEVERFRKSLPDAPGATDKTMDIFTVLTPKEDGK